MKVNNIAICDNIKMLYGHWTVEFCGNLFCKLPKMLCWAFPIEIVTDLFGFMFDKLKALV